MTYPRIFLFLYFSHTHVGTTTVMHNENFSFTLSRWKFTFAIVIGSLWCLIFALWIVSALFSSSFYANFAFFFHTLCAGRIFCVHLCKMENDKKSSRSLSQIASVACCCYWKWKKSFSFPFRSILVPWKVPLAFNSSLSDYSRDHLRVFHYSDIFVTRIFIAFNVNFWWIYLNFYDQLLSML